MPWRRGVSGARRSSVRESGAAQHVRLEQRLVLLSWLKRACSATGATVDLLSDLKEAPEGFDAAGRSHIYHRLTARGELQVPAADLARYDDNVRAHLDAVNARRSEPITLRYFQHAALLHTELFLDRYFHGRGELIPLAETGFAADRKRCPAVRRPRPARRRLHAIGPEEAGVLDGDRQRQGRSSCTSNYRQFLHYHRRPLDKRAADHPETRA